MSLDGVGLATLDVDKIYSNMTENLGTGSCRAFLERRQQQGGQGDEHLVSANSILKAIELCIKNNYFEFEGKIYKQIGGVRTAQESNWPPPLHALAWKNLKTWHSTQTRI